MSKSSSSRDQDVDFNTNNKAVTYESLQFIEPSQTPPAYISHRRVGLKTISFLFACIFLPLIAFSIVILWLIFHYRVTPDNSSSFPDLQAGPNENEGPYYYVNFSATQILFIASWSSTVAPISVGAVMTLSLFPISRKLFQISLSQSLQRLPTPYQFSLLLGLSEGNKRSWWNFLRYSFRKKRARHSTGLKISALIYSIAVIISTLIVIVDTVLHITTKTVSIYKITAIPSPNVTFGKGLTSDCANWTAQTDYTGVTPLAYPCTVFEAVTSAGMLNGNEVYKTINNISTENQVFQVSTGNATTGDLFILGPGQGQNPIDSDYKATTIGVSTSCEAISTLCNLEAPEGAATIFNCSSGWGGNIEVPEFTPTALIHTSAYDSQTELPENYTSMHNNFGLGVFADQNLTKAYDFIGYNASLGHTTPNPFYLGAAALVQSAGASLANDSELVNGGHGGYAFVLRCEVHTYDVTYSYVNGTVPSASVAAVPNNGTMGWNFLGPMSYQQERLAQLVDLAGVQDTSTELALSYGNSFSGFAVALLAGAYDGRTVLEQQIRNELLVAKVLKSMIWLLVLFNMLFALGGAVIAVWAFLVAMTGIGDAHALFSLEEVVGMCFEREKFEARGEVEERFEEQRVGEMSGRVGVARREDGWALQRVNVHS
ncbi:uncharacterized protein LY89DRAFT_789039 [Mollisia scopiformis]|uniref:Uncharacterized protein n=1 Tax=Mollisia scopiformis TaxID=149040 RepID=A0A132B711_MOLSC|nr:uncharacterized protein LY89DRAFT_789039 [Mollisia scopiformis]KUJ08198.1 hypothetical protein LY89DRAFT_789039 [Mollisia scopiformis]